MTINNAGDYLRRVSPYRYFICDNCRLERYLHPHDLCPDGFRHTFPDDEPLAGMGMLHGRSDDLGDEPHLRSV